MHRVSVAGLPRDCALLFLELLYQHPCMGGERASICSLIFSSKLLQSSLVGYQTLSNTFARWCGFPKTMPWKPSRSVVGETLLTTPLPHYFWRCGVLRMPPINLVRGDMPITEQSALVNSELRHARLTPLCNFICARIRGSA